MCLEHPLTRETKCIHLQMKVRLAGEVLVILVAFGVVFFKADSSDTLPTMVFRKAEGLLTQCYTVNGFSFWTKFSHGLKGECSSSISSEWNHNRKQGAHPRTRLQTPAQIEQHLHSKSYNNSTEQTVMSYGEWPSFMAWQREVLPSPVSPSLPTTLREEPPGAPAGSSTLHTASLWHCFRQRGNRGEAISLPAKLETLLRNFLTILSAGEGFFAGRIFLLLLLKNTTLTKIVYVISVVT